MAADHCHSASLPLSCFVPKERVWYILRYWEGSKKRKNRKKTDATLLIKKAKGCNIIFSDNRQDFSNDGDFKHCLPMGFKLFGHASVYIILTPFCPAQMKRRARGKKTTLLPTPLVCFVSTCFLSATCSCVGVEVLLAKKKKRWKKVNKVIHRKK